MFPHVGWDTPSVFAWSGKDDTEVRRGFEMAAAAALYFTLASD